MIPFDIDWTIPIGHKQQFEFMIKLTIWCWRDSEVTCTFYIFHTALIVQYYHIFIEKTLCI
jgi:hypothetical protein